MTARPICIQWNCRSFTQNGSTLRQQIKKFKPLVVLLQETRGPCTIQGYRTFQQATILHQGKGNQQAQGQAALLVRHDCTATELQIPDLCNDFREIVAVKLCPRGHRPMVAVSAYYRPLTGKHRNDSYQWLGKVQAQAGGLPILVGGDFNAKHQTWGYAKADSRGRILHDAIEMSALDICNTPETPTRIGLHARQQDTTPDLTLATPGLIRQWDVESTTWGSDHLPIIITLNRKKIRERRETVFFDWKKFRMATGDSFADFEQFSAMIAEARPEARETIPCDDTTSHMDMHLANLWRKVNRLTQQYRYKGKRHKDLMRLKHQYRLIKEYQQQLEADTWHNTCAKLGREPGLKRLWQILRSLLGRKKGAPPLAELFLREEPAVLEERVIHTFFPHAAEAPPEPLPSATIDNAKEELDTPFTLSELVAALAQGKTKSAPGHDGVTWQELRNLSNEAQERLLTIVNESWESGLVPDSLKLSLIYPIPKPGKDHTKPANLRPIALTSTICKLIERMLNTRMQHYMEYVQPGLHPAQAGFRPNMGTHDCLWLLRRVINRKSRKQMPDYILAVDMRKAFDNVKQEVILQELATRYPSQRTYNWIRSFLQSRPIQLHGKAPGWSPRTYYLDRGVPQGSILGPMLFNLAMTRVAESLERDTSARFTIYADDITIWTEAADYSDMQSMQTELQAAILSLSNTLDNLGLQLSPEKTELISVDGKKATNVNKQITLHIGKSDITSTNGQIRILGAQIASCNSPQLWIRTLKQKWRPLLHMVRRISSKYGGARQKACQTLAKAVAVGRILYGAPVYEFSERDLSDIEKLHRATLRTITGLPKHTRNEDLLKLVAIPPIRDIINEARIRMRSRLENTTQGKQIIAWDKQVHAKPEPAEATITPPWEAPLGIRRQQRPIARRNVEARQIFEKRLELRTPQHTIDIYTDAAIKNDMASMAWVSTSAPQHNGYHTCQLPGGATLHAELLAIWGAVNTIPIDMGDIVEQNVRNNYRILTDSYEAVAELTVPTTDDAVANDTRKMLKRIQDNGTNVEIIWTPGHTGTDGGNAAAHAVAAQAGGLDYTYSSPHSISSPNPADQNPYLKILAEGSPSRALMHYIRTKIKADSKRRLLEATPVHVFDNGGLTRTEEVFLNKVMANAAYTPHILEKWHQTRQATTANTYTRCTHCQESCRADLQHLIWNCAAFSQGRSNIQHLLHGDIRTLGIEIQTNPETQKAIATYGRQSGLFRVV